MGGSTKFEAFDRLVAERMRAWTDELAEFCRIPSEAADPAALREAATCLTKRLERAGAARPSLTRARARREHLTRALRQAARAIGRLVAYWATIR